MSEELTRDVVLKRSSKKKAGYVISEKDGDYVITEIPAKARLNVGDKVRRINGIGSDEFEDADDANGLIECIRIVVVPEDKIKEYEAAKNAEEAGGDEESSEEEYEEVQRPRSVKNVKPKSAKASKKVPEQETALVVREEEGEDQVYTCPDCGHDNVNPERDEDGDLVCEECGTVLPETFTATCHDCGHENVDPEPDEEGDYVCEECGTILNVDDPRSHAERLKAMNDEVAETVADGQTFGADGKPVTNPEGCVLTPADMFSPGDVITVTVGKSNPKQDPGLKIEEVNGKVYVRKVPSSGLFAKTPVIAGDKVLELNGVDTRNYQSVNDMKLVMRDEERITVVVLRRDPDASESSASSVDYDNLAPVTADGDYYDEGSYDTVGYDGHDCGCAWCPECKGEVLAITDGPANDSDSD